VAYGVTATGGKPVTEWPDGKYSPPVVDRNHLYLIGLGRMYAFSSS